MLGVAPSANVGKRGKCKSECHSWKRQDRMRNILSIFFKKKEETTDISRQMWIILAFKI